MEHVVTRAMNAVPVCRLCQLIIYEINSRVPPGPEKLPEAGARREISLFPDGPVSATASCVLAAQVEKMHLQRYWIQ